MKRYTDTVLQTTVTGLTQPAAGANVTVLVHSSGLPATIYSDDGITTISNPLTADINGRFSFYVADGRYDLRFSGAGLTTYTLSDIAIEDLGSHGILVPTGSVNGSNTVFTIPNISGGVQLVLRNGVTQNPGAGNDYTIVGTTLTFSAAPSAGDSLLIIY